MATARMMGQTSAQATAPIVVYAQRQRTQADIDSEIRVLTISDARRLSAEAPFTIEQFDTMTEAFQRISLPGFSFGLPFVSAMAITELVLALALIWFWLYYQEARRCAGFPSAGTLFAVLSRSPASQAVFVLLLALPVAASVYLGVAVITARTEIRVADRVFVGTLTALAVIVTIAITRIYWLANRTKLKRFFV
jgi:hypothetical protein